jgi:hypothetical protein
MSIISRNLIVFISEKKKLRISKLPIFYFGLMILLNLSSKFNFNFTLFKMFSSVKSEPYKLGNRELISENVYESFEDAVGNTPLLKLKRASELTKCNIYGKCEFMSVGGSVKDRAALYLIK